MSRFRSVKRRKSLTLFTLGMVLSVSASAAAQDVSFEPAAVADEFASSDQVEHLDRWLYATRTEGRRNRMVSGSLATLGSALLVAFGTVALLDDSPRTEFSKGFGFVAVAAGGATLVMGATLLAIPSPAEKRYGRWQSVQSQGVTDVELARFEGELRYSLTVRANGKLRQRRWGSLGLVLGGASLIGLKAASNLSTLAQRLGYGVGGTLAGVGMVGFGLSFMKPRDLWERYEVGLPPRGTELVRATLKITPLLTRRAAGLCVNARF